MSVNYSSIFPEHWNKSDLHSLAEWINGLAFRQFNFNDEGQTPVIKINELKYGITGQTQFTNQEFDKDYFLKKGDMLFSWSGSPETSIDMFWFDMERGWLNQHIFKVIPRNGIDTNFFFYLLKYLKPQFIQIAKDKQTTGLGHVTRGDLKEFQVAYPELPTQQKIAEHLKDIDDKIYLNNEINILLEEIARAIFKEWFVDFNYPNANAQRKHSDFGEIPIEWNVSGIGEISFVQNGYAFKSNDFRDEGEIGIIKIKNINGNVVDVENTDYVDTSIVKKLDQKFRIETGSLLIAMTGAEVGKVGLVPVNNKQLWLNQRVGMFKEKTLHGNLFMYLLLSTENYRNTIRNSALGSAQPNISATTIESIRAIIPSHELITKFGEVVKPMFEKILNNLSENEMLKATRENLLPKLMAGEIEIQ